MFIRRNWLFLIILLNLNSCCPKSQTHESTTTDSSIVKTDTLYITDTVYIEQPDTLDDWQLMTMAIVGVESEYNGYAVAEDKYHGFFQMNEYYMKKASQLTGKDINKNNIHEFENALDAFLAMNDEINPSYDIDEAIRIHNPGGGKSYLYKIKKRMQEIKKYEIVRKKLKDAYENFD